LIFSGCDKIHFKTYDASKEEADIALDQVNDEIIIDGQVTSEDVVVEDPENPKLTEGASTVDSNIQPVTNTQLTIYTIDSNSGNIIPVTALIPEGNEITPELIVTTVVESMADQSLMIGIENITTKDAAVIVSFYSDQPPLMGVSGGIEAAILNAIAQSLLDNLDDYSEVIYRVEGNAYVSDYYELKIDEVYLGDN